MTETYAIRERLRNLLIEKAYLTGDFVLTSGKRSSHYFDTKQVTLDGEGLPLCADLIVAKMRAAGIKVIGGLTLGADPLVAGVVDAGYRLGYPIGGYIARKEPKKHGTTGWIEGPVEAGMRVAVIDDVVTSGGSLIRAIDISRQEMLEPLVAYALVDRGEGGAENVAKTGVPFEPLFRYSELFPGT
ncbi:MAG: orotate phosphoribosyltransferase [Thermoleophilia bacterium]|nr:orotate phosphoribosyltransferase [Thermoleophilia bacterium]